MFYRKEPTIGLALGSGGAKGLSHIGVIKVLVEHGIPIDIVAGTSIGALIGGLYAATKDITVIEKLALSTNWRELLALVDPSLRKGLIGGGKIQRFIEAQVGKKNIEDLPIPFAAVATDLSNGQPVVITKGDLASAIRASIALPLVFAPLSRQGQMLTDGGLSLPIPAEVVRKMGADIVIAINLDADYFADTQGKRIGFRSIANNIVRILRFHLAKENIQYADLVIAPKVGAVGWGKLFTAQRTREVIAIGERAMEEHYPDLERLIAQKRKTFFGRLRHLLFTDVKKLL